MNNPIEHSPWCETVLIVDADYADRVAFHLTVNFERMLERRIPKGDLSTWLVCMALDGGAQAVAGDDRGTPAAAARPTTQAILLHDRQHQALENFVPARYADEIDGQAFADERLGEFLLTAVEADETLVGRDALFLDIVGTVLAQPEVKRVVIVPDAEQGTLYDDLRETLRRHDTTGKQLTVLTMEPLPGGPFRQDLLGYSVMAALGISGRELAKS